MQESQEPRITCHAERRAFSAESVLKTSSIQAKAKDGFVRTLRTVSSCAHFKTSDILHKCDRGLFRHNHVNERHKEFLVVFFKPSDQHSVVPFMLSERKGFRCTVERFSQYRTSMLPKETLIMVSKRNLDCIIRCPNEPKLGTDSIVCIS